MTPKSFNRPLLRSMDAKLTALVFCAVLVACKRRAPELHPTPTAEPRGTAVTAATQTRPSAATNPATSLAPVKVERDHQAMGTSVKFVVYTNDAVDATAAGVAIDSAIQEMARLEAQLSEWQPDSEVSRVNQAAGQWVNVGPETAEIIDEALWISEASEGAFDITFHVMGDLWKFGSAEDRRPQVPNAVEVRRRRALIDYHRVELDRVKSRVRIPKGRKIGLGGIAKGYVVDRAVSVLRTAGLRSFLVQAGGDFYAAGCKPDGSHWVAAIQDPRAPEGTYFATLEIEDHAFSTAGDYARAYVVKAKRYHHIIDPRTGFPANASRSVTVYARDAMTADMVDDAVFVLGPQRGLKLAESFDDVGVVVVDAKNRLWISPKLKDKVAVHQSPTDGI